MLSALILVSCGDLAQDTRLPEMDITAGILVVPNGGNYDFGEVNVNSQIAAATFTITNSGSADLILSGSPMVGIDGVDAAMFSIGTQPSSPVAASQSTIFTIIFSPSSVGPKAAVVHIPNNDSDEAGYSFWVAGTGI
jgi:hypothetical protein